MQLRHSRRARADLLDIWATVAAESPRAADRLFDRLEARVRVLVTDPQAGMARTDIAPQARMLVLRPYLILYRLIPGGSEVIRVVHGARALDEALFSEGLD